MQLLSEQTTSFVGGQNDSASPTAFKQVEAAEIVNYRVRPDGSLSPRGGSKKTHAAALNAGAQFYGGTTFRPTTGDEQWVVFCGSAMFTSTDEGATWTSRATALRTDYWSLSTMRVGTTNYLLCVNGGATAYKWDGTTWSTLANVPSGAKYGAVFNERFYVAGHSGNLVQASKVADPEVWTVPSGLALQVQTHDGDTDIRGLFQIGSVLLVFKRNSTAYVNGFGYSDIVVASGATGLSRSVGCLAFRTVQAAGDSGAMWLSERGIESYAAGGEIRLVSNKVRTFFSDISWSDIVSTPGMPVALFYPAEHEYWCAVPAAGGTNNYTVVYNLQTGATTLFRYRADSGGTLYIDTDGFLVYTAEGDRSLGRTEASFLTVADPSEAGYYVTLDADGFLAALTATHNHSILFSADTSDQNSAPISGGYDGFVRRLETGTVDNASSDGTGGSTIAYTTLSRPHLFGRRFNRKRARKAAVLVVSDDPGTLTVSVVADGAEGQTHDETVAASLGGQPRRVFSRINGRGHTLQLRTATTDPLAIASTEIMAEVLRERI